MRWRRIPRVATGLTVQGGLELVMAFALLAGAMDSDTKAPSSLYDGLMLRVAPPLLLLGGALKAFAAARNRRFRSRGIGLMALWSALPTALVWLCAPTGLALFGYGIIVYGDPTSREAFALGDKSMSPQEIERALSLQAERPA